MTTLKVSEYILRSAERPGFDDICICLASQRAGSDKWAVRRHGDCLNKHGEWECEPLPSSRDDAFLARCRFESAEDAARVWGMPAADAPYVWAWQHEEDETRVISATKKAQALADGGASASSVRPYSIALVRAAKEDVRG